MSQQPIISIALSEEQINSIIKSAVKNKKIEINTIINKPQKQWFTVAEAADYIGVNKQTIYQYVDNYKHKKIEKPCLKYSKIGGNVRIRIEWLEELGMSNLVNRHLNR
jgi:excisionase family DNA binding protein